MINFITSNLLWTSGWPVALFLGLLLVASFFFKYIFYIFLPLFLFSFYFFRNPERVCKEFNSDKNVLVSPSDGKVLYIQKGDFNGFSQKIAIFLSPLDVHVNWVPCKGIIQDVVYRPGKFLVAFEPKSSELNERNDILIQADNGQLVLVRQIAGFVARRICCWVDKDQSVGFGEKYGMIRFGSRMEIFLSDDVEILLNEGQRVFGGETVLGRFK